MDKEKGRILTLIFSDRTNGYVGLSLTHTPPPHLYLGNNKRAVSDPLKLDDSIHIGYGDRKIIKNVQYYLSMQLTG